TLSLWLIARIDKDPGNWFNWIAFGLSAGLCIMSKFHGVFLWMAMAAFIIFLKRSWLSRPQLYTAGLVTLIIISPIFIWNIQNHFATYRFHSGRVEINEAAIHWRS